MRTRECTASVRRGRLRRAEEFLAAASVLGDGGETASTDPQVSLYVLAGIAAADVICCAGLGEHSVGEDHGQAIALLKRADARSAPYLARLLKLKSKAGYTEAATSATERTAAERAATELVERARLLSAGQATAAP